MSNYSLTLNQRSPDGNIITIDLLNLKKGALVLRALNHKLRQQIVKLIDESEKITVTEIYTHLRIEQSVASQHLAILRKAGIVDTSRNGKYIFYSINVKRVDELNEMVSQLLK
ncbi:MAG: metalloregulator ArsR/SmtB family transcription factor [Terrimonas sp.]|nr:metalloregulator ArsR/SmtB family transcription factor [Terrimonas sp.]